MDNGNVQEILREIRSQGETIREQGLAIARMDERQKGITVTVEATSKKLETLQNDMTQLKSGVYKNQVITGFVGTAVGAVVTAAVKNLFNR